MITDARTLIGSLRCGVCPACGREKRGGKTLCGSCYHQLPQDLKNSLYCRVGQGYEQAVEAAFKFLRKTELILPEAR